MRKRIACFILFLFTNISLLLAQGPGGLPGGGGTGGCSDPDDPACADPENVPLDNWIVLFALAALIITVVYLRRKAKQTAVIAQ